MMLSSMFDFDKNTATIGVGIVGNDDIIQNQPWTTTPTHYGGSPTRDKRLHWSFLPRVATLPSTASFKIKRSPEAKKLFKRLFGGDFAFRCHSDVSTTNILAVERSSFIVSVFESAESPHPVLIMRLTLSDGLSDGDTKGTSVEFMNVHEIYDFFYNVLRFEDKPQLSLRLLHNIMRQHGAFLPKKLVDFFLSYLTLIYGDNKDYNASLDVALCYADILVSNQEAQHKIALAFLKVGEGLEAIEAYEMAAETYQRSADLAADDKRMQWHLCKFAGLAFKRNAQYAKSEEAYYRALHLKVLHDERTLQMHDEDFRALVKNVLYLYAVIIRLERAVSRPLNDMEEMESVITTLFHAAGFDAGVGDESVYLLGSVQHRAPAIKPQFLTNEGARLALLVAILKPSYNGYRKHLLNCLKPDQVIMIQANLENPYTIHSHNRVEAMEFELARSREEISKSESDSKTLQCSNTGCQAFEPEEKQFKHCPCKAVFYCSADCQRAHWDHGHKQHCGWRKKRTEQKAERKLPRS